jgi:hypothetical protein
MSKYLGQDKLLAHAAGINTPAISQAEAHQKRLHLTAGASPGCTTSLDKQQKGGERDGLQAYLT